MSCSRQQPLDSSLSNTGSSPQYEVALPNQHRRHSPVLATELLVLFTVDSSHFDDALQRLSHLTPFGDQILAMPTPASPALVAFLNKHQCHHPKVLTHLRECAPDERSVQHLHNGNRAGMLLSDLPTAVTVGSIWLLQIDA